MARTLRRNKKYLIFQCCGTLDDAHNDRWFYSRGNRGDLTPQQAYDRHVARFRRDHPSGRYGVPSWFTRTHARRPQRRFEKMEIHRCIRKDEWDDHISSPNTVHRPYWW